MNDDEQGMSPVALSVKEEDPRIQMDFFDAMKMLADGKKITRIAWETEKTYGVLQDGYVCIMRDGKTHTWTINDGDLMGIDWVLV